MSTLTVTIISLVGCFFIGMPIFMSLILSAVIAIATCGYLPLSINSQLPVRRREPVSASRNSLFRHCRNPDGARQYHQADH